MDWQNYKQQIKEFIARGELDQAEKLLREAIDFLKSNNGSVERITVCLDQLGWIYIGREDFQNASEQYKQALQLKLDALGENHPVVARAYKKMATVSYMMNNFPDAERYGKEALNNFRNSLGNDNEETQQTLKDVAELLRRLNRNVEADIIERSGNKKEDEEKSSRREEVQTFLRISICQKCELPYDGETCPRCE